MNVHIEFDPGMVGKGVLMCYITSLRKWSIDLPQGVGGEHYNDSGVFLQYSFTERLQP